MTDLELVKELLKKVHCSFDEYTYNNGKITTIESDCCVAFDFYEDGSLKSIYGLNQE